MIPDLQPQHHFIHLGLGWIGDKGGGLERYQDGICQAHAESGARVTAWVQSRVPIHHQERSYHVEAYASPTDSRQQRRSSLRQVAAEALNQRDAILVSHHASVSHGILAMAKMVPHTVHFQGPWADEAAVEGAPWWKTWVQRRHERRVYQSADRVITLSTVFKNIVIEKYGVHPDRVHVVPGAIDANRADPSISRAEARERLGWSSDPLFGDRKIIVCIRRLVRRVGVLELVDAAELVAKKHPECLFLIGGTGALREDLETRIRERGLERTIQLLGFVPDEELQITYAAADYSIVPTQSLEGFGLVMLESLIAGTPAMVTPIGSLPEVMRPFSESMVLPGCAPEQMAEGIREILSGSLPTPDGETCKKHVRQNYDWNQIAPRIMKVYLDAAR